jgi:sigma-B regulation protein RsbU (phosphoserine phosphatase)
MRVLIADDDRGSAAIVGSAVSQWGYEVTTVSDGDAAWHQLQSHAPPLAVLDWMMPGIDGLELCRRIRLDPATVHTHVTLLTSRDVGADRVAGLDAGADDYLVKPFDREELRARMQAGTRAVSIQRQLVAQVTLLQQALDRVRQLEGLLSVCSYCKRIRSAEHAWEQMETYISEHSNATFSHGICPTCLVLEEPGPPMRTDAQTILLVDDEAAVRSLFSTVLRRAGYHVVAAGNTTDAVAQAAAVRGSVHLVITDVMLPVGTGAQLAATLSAGGLGAPVLFISGYDAPTLVRQGHLQGTSHFLQKPFTSQALLAAVRHLTTLAPTPIDTEPNTCAS